MTTVTPTIQPQTTVKRDDIPPLDPSLFTPSKRTLDFLKQTISPDEDEIRRRVGEVQKEAYERYPYPCIRGYHHVALMMSENKAYTSVIEAGRTDPDALLLDIGCCMGTDVRKLIQDGFPGNQVLACDLLPEFIALGFELYQDKDTGPVHFFAADVFEITLATPITAPAPSKVPIAEVKQLTDLFGRISFLYAGAFFHLWDESTQHALALRFALLLKTDKPIVIFGRHQALPEAGYIDDHLQRKRYGHSPESWEKLWKSVLEAVHGPEFAHSKVKVNAELYSSNPKFIKSGAVLHYMMYWSVEISA